MKSSPLRLFCFLLLCWIGNGAISAQTAADSIQVELVKIIGHKKTRASTIFREMPFSRGDQLAISSLPEKIREARANLMNTGLFAGVDITYEDWKVPGNRVTFVVTIRENWYIYPVPIFELADRNFNVWWREQNRDLDRVNIGLRFSHFNFTGRADELKLSYQYGYTREYRASYDLPYLNKAQNLGWRISMAYLRRREQNYQTLNDQQLFFEADNFVYQQGAVETELTYRRRLYVSHSLLLGYRNEQVSDTIAKQLNPNFFRVGLNRQRFFRFEYEFRVDRRDVRNYPWQGDFIRFRLNKEGLGIFGERDGMTLWADYRKFIPFGKKKKSSLNASLAAKYSPIRTRQPFLENRAIGFGEYGMVGYQFYVIDGLDMVILRTGLRRELFKGNVDLGKLVFIDAFRYIPWRLVLSGQVDQGWSNAPFNEGRNQLNNRWLVGSSVGLDLI
ncbi:MAG: BamA/TamA family outer membrane protein, partial [Bacteroidota bacterium]